jgi:hypothetical protein
MTDIDELIDALWDATFFGANATVAQRDACKKRYRAVIESHILDITALRAELAEAREAIKPFAAFNECLKEWRYAREVFPLQKAWPKDTPVLNREFPRDKDSYTVVRIYPADFSRAAKFMEG